MELNEYQIRALNLEKDSGLTKDEKLIVWGLGISGEAGEVSDNIKKWIRDDDYYMKPRRREEMTTELGDVLWYVSGIAYLLGVSLSELAEGNLKKLRDRREKEKRESPNYSVAHTQ